jgi:hypothetical protein
MYLGKGITGSKIHIERKLRNVVSAFVCPVLFSCLLELFKLLADFLGTIGQTADFQRNPTDSSGR